MTKNIGSIDKIIRFTIAIVIGVLYFTEIITDTLGTVLLAVAAILVITAFINFCPIWAVLRIKTTPKAKE